MYNKIGSVKLTNEEVKKLLDKDYLYIVAYRKVYQLTYSKNAGFGGLLIYTQEKSETLPLTKRGRFVAMNSKQLNDLLGFELVCNI